LGFISTLHQRQLAKLLLLAQHKFLLSPFTVFSKVCLRWILARKALRRMIAQALITLLIIQVGLALTTFIKRVSIVEGVHSP
jgi:hypothetical protein